MDNDKMLELNEEMLAQVAGGLNSAKDEAKWKDAFPSGTTVRAKFRTCGTCMYYYKRNHNEFRLTWGSYRMGFSVICTNCSTPLKYEGMMEWKGDPADAFDKC